MHECHGEEQWRFWHNRLDLSLSAPWFHFVGFANPIRQAYLHSTINFFFPQVSKWWYEHCALSWCPAFVVKSDWKRYAAPRPPIGWLTRRTSKRSLGFEIGPQCFHIFFRNPLLWQIPFSNSHLSASIERSAVPKSWSSSRIWPVTGLRFFLLVKNFERTYLDCPHNVRCPLSPLKTIEECDEVTNIFRRPGLKRCSQTHIAVPPSGWKQVSAYIVLENLYVCKGFAFEPACFGILSTQLINIAPIRSYFRWRPWTPVLPVYCGLICCSTSKERKT